MKQGTNVGRTKGTCFVLMSFRVSEEKKTTYPDHNHWSEVYEGLINPAAEIANLRCMREDKDVAGKLIVESILRKIESSDIILCDLSGHNPNVFLELGWSLRADKPFVLIKDELTDYTFDLANVFAFTYSSQLRPITLRKETQELASIIKNTASDANRRYSLVRTLQLSLSAFEAAAKGDYTTELLLDIRRQMTGFQQLTRSYPRRGDDFPWPVLIRQGSDLLMQIKDILEQDTGSSTITEELLSDLARNRGVWRNESIQFSVIDGNGRFVYHDWFSGQQAALIIADTTDLFTVAQEKPFGAVSWTDSSGNAGEYGKYRGRRLNIALFASTKDQKWRVVVELHFFPGTVS